MTRWFGLAAQTAQEFLPITPFYMSIFVEQKGFTHEEMESHVIPSYFYASFLSLFFVYPAIKILGYIPVLIATVCAQLLPIFLVSRMKKRNLLVGRAVYALGGACAIYKSILRAMLINSDGSAAFWAAMMKFLRHLVASLSAWIGQGIHNETCEYGVIAGVSMAASIVSGSFSIIDAVLDSLSPTSKPPKSGITLQECKDSFKELSLRTVGPYVLCGSAAAILHIYFIVYLHAIFQSKAKKEINGEKEASSFFKIIDTPVKYISHWLVSIFSFARSHKISEKPSAAKSGYLEGFLKTLASFCALIVVKFAPQSNRKEFLIATFMMGLLFFFFMCHSRSVRLSKVLFFLAIVCIVVCENVGRSFIYKSKNRLFIATLVLLIESLMHTSINSTCKFLRLSPVLKSYCYLTIGCLMLIPVVFSSYLFV